MIEHMSRAVKLFHVAASITVCAVLFNDMPLSKSVQGNLADHGLTPQQETQLQHKGMECLVSILKCLVEWSKDMYRRPQQRVEEIAGESREIS